ncbi:hypothetical protein DNTS_008304, partial [Danionella cerebrum]
NHITIQNGRSFPELKKCTTCCMDIHCPFCNTRRFRPTKLCKVQLHLKSHIRRAVFYKGYTIHRCGLGCRTKWHYHCFNCTSTRVRKDDFLKHLFVCTGEQPATVTTTQEHSATVTTTQEQSATVTTTQEPATSTIESNAADSVCDIQSSSAASVFTIPIEAASIAPPLTPITFPATPASNTQRACVKPVLRKNCPICQLSVNK